jgi:hypothetical protein
MINSWSIRNMWRIDCSNKLSKKRACCWSLLSKLGVEMESQVFLNLGMRSFTPLIFYLARSWVGPRTGLSAMEKINITRPVPEINLNRSVVRPTGRTPTDHKMHQTLASIPALSQNGRDRLNIKISIHPNFTAMVTRHGQTRAYRHRFRLIDNATCPCNKEAQTVDHLIYRCTLLHTNRELLRVNVQQSGNWPAS